MVAPRSCCTSAPSGMARKEREDQGLIGVHILLRIALEKHKCKLDAYFVVHKVVETLSRPMYNSVNACVGT
jgi:hypothetical protein